jgi:signal transduction histidine kinase
MNLRRRIVLTTSLLLVVSCVLFTVASLAALDRALKQEADKRLNTIADAIAQVVDFHYGHLSIDADDRSQIAALHGPEQHYAVLDAHRHLVAGEAVPAGVAARGVRFATTSRLHEHGIGTIVVWQGDAWIARIDRELLLTFVAAGFILVVIGAAMSRLLADRILRPVERIASLAEQIEADDLSSRIEVAGNDEIGRLCASFDRMLDRLQASFETERRFVADASHELRTPLAVVRAETDLALRRERSAGEYREAFVSIDTEVSQLEALIDDLLDTMRDRAVTRTDAVDVVQLVTRVAERIRPATREIRVHFTGERPIVRGHKQSIERAATAVLHNAITHGGAGSIDVRVARNGNRVRIDVVDDGPGFGAEALVHATERFWRADSARSRGGTGLGLSIARVLVEAHGGEVNLANAPGQGAVVSLVLPTA